MKSRGEKREEKREGTVGKEADGANPFCADEREGEGGAEEEGRRSCRQMQRRVDTARTQRERQTIKKKAAKERRAKGGNSRAL